jgi:hypothetical protein
MAAVSAVGPWLRRRLADAIGGTSGTVTSHPVDGPTLAQFAADLAAIRQLIEDARHARRLDPSWLNLVHRPIGVVDRVECLAEVVGDGVGGGDGVRPGLDLDDAVAAGSLDESADRPAGLVLDPAADSEGGEDDGEVGLEAARFTRSRANSYCRDCRYLW